MITLNEQQQKVHDVLVDYLCGTDKSKTSWVLKGYAGTGKTTTIGTVIRTVMERKSHGIFGGPCIAVSAPTHKAVQVLKKMQAFKSDVTYSTIHSLLGLKEHIDPDTGKQSFQPDYDSKYAPPIESVEMLIIDEVSMLPNELFTLLIPYVRGGMKLVMMGDPVQIPPVNEGDPIPFIPAQCEKHNIGVLELTDIVRQAQDNPILAYATELRKVYKTGNPTPSTNIVGDMGVNVIPAGFPEKLDNILNRYFTSMEFQDDPDYAKVIAWTNSVVNSANTVIRRMIYGTMPAKIVKNEKLICDKPVMRSGSIVLSTNMEMEVLDFEIKRKELEFIRNSFPDNELVTADFKYYACRVKYIDIDLKGNLVTKYEQVDIIHEDDEEKFAKYQKELKQCAVKNPVKGIRAGLWRKYYDNEKKFAWIKYNYAITAHKSQGSTYDNAIVLEWDMQKNRKVEERNRIRYVAATRPRKMLHIVV